jgi:hypothetical protein
MPGKRTLLVRSKSWIRVSVHSKFETWISVVITGGIAMVVAVERSAHL